MSEDFSFDEVASKKKELLRKIQDNINSIEESSGKLVSEQPNIVDAIRNLRELVMAQDDFLSMLTQDLGTLLVQLKNLQTASLITELKQQTSLTVLKEKGQVTEEEFQETWERDVIPELEKMGLIKKKSNIIVAGNGNKKIIVP